jgi:hypothetical protein
VAPRIPRADGVENTSGGLLDMLQALRQQLGVTLVKLDVILRRRSCLKPDCLADDKCYSSASVSRLRFEVLARRSSRCINSWATCAPRHPKLERGHVAREARDEAAALLLYKRPPISHSEESRECRRCRTSI